MHDTVNTRFKEETDYAKYLEKCIYATVNTLK